MLKEVRQLSAEVLNGYYGHQGIQIDIYDNTGDCIYSGIYHLDNYNDILDYCTYDDIVSKISINTEYNCYINDFYDNVNDLVNDICSMLYDITSEIVDEYDGSIYYSDMFDEMTEGGNYLTILDRVCEYLLSDDDITNMSGGSLLSTIYYRWLQDNIEHPGEYEELENLIDKITDK